MKKRMLARVMSYGLSILVAFTSMQLPAYAAEIVVEKENDDSEVLIDDENDEIVAERIDDESDAHADDEIVEKEEIQDSENGEETLPKESVEIEEMIADEDEESEILTVFEGKFKSVELPTYRTGGMEFEYDVTTHTAALTLITEAVSVVIPSKITIGEEEYTVDTIKTNLVRDNASPKILQNLTIPKSIVTMEENAFKNFQELAWDGARESHIYYTGTPDDWVKIKFESNWFANPMQVFGKIVFNGQAGPESEVTLSEGTTSIGDYAFFCVSQLKTINLPSTLTSIGDSAFMETSLESIVIPDNVSEIKYNAFCQIYTLKSITLPKNLEIIDYYLFMNDRALTSVVIPKGVTEIREEAFSGCDLLSSVTIPDTVTKIGPKAFAFCGALKKVVIPKSVTNISSLLFNKSGLEEIVIPKEVTSVADNAFSDCELLRKIKVYEGSYADLNWAKFVDVTKVTKEYIDDSAIDPEECEHDFTKYVSLGNGKHKVVCKNCDTTQEGHDNDDCSGGAATCSTKAKCEKCGAEYGKLAETVHSFSADCDTTCDDCGYVRTATGKHDFTNNGTCTCGLTQITFDIVEDEKIARVTGPNRDLDMTGDLIIPSTVKVDGEDYIVNEIANHAFENCEFTGKLTLPNNVTRIGYRAFDACRFTGKLIIPESVTDILALAFSDCRFTGDLTIPDSVKRIDAKAFLNAGFTGKLTIGKSLTEIGSNTFWSCGFTGDIDIPDNIKTIGQNVFADNPISTISVPCSIDISEIVWGIDSEKIKQRNHDFSEESNAEKCFLCGVKNINYSGFDSAVVPGDKLYTGGPITSEVTITGLNEGIDYTVENVTETEIGKYEVKVTGIGEYAGERIVYWQILPAKGLWFADIPDQTYTGKNIKPVVEVYCDGVHLVAGKDYTITYGKYNTNVAAKDATSKGKDIAPSVTITGKGNYSEKMTRKFAIVERSVETAVVNDILVAKSSNAINITPAVEVNGRMLKLGTDYVVSTTTDETGAITSLKTPGKYDLYVVGKKNYTGYSSFSFTITEKTLASKVKIEVKDQEYNGGKIEPKIKVTYSKKDITADFDITYKNNTEIGTATVIITAKDGSNFVGTKTATFKITGTQMKNAKLGANGKGTIPSRVYDGTAYEPALDLYVGSSPLAQGTDYEVTYTKNVNAGTATATVVGKGKYVGSKIFTYKITAYNAEKDVAGLIKVNDGADISVTYDKGGATPQPVITAGTKELINKIDYTISYANNTAVKDKVASKAPKMIITFKGNYSGKKTVLYSITQKDISGCTMTVNDMVVSTKANGWKQTKVTIKDTNGKTLKASTDYKATFEYFSDSTCTTPISATKLGADEVVYVKVTGDKNYLGTITGSYRISKKSITSAKTSVKTQTFTGSEIKPTAEEITVKIGKSTTPLVAGTEYEIVPGTYKNNINIGKASVTIRGIGDYCGTTVVTYQIEAKKFLWWDLEEE